MDQQQERALRARRWASEAVHALLSDDHSYELGVLNLHQIIGGVSERAGAEGLADLSVELALTLSEALERIASEQGLAAVDLIDVWFAE